MSFFRNLFSKRPQSTAPFFRSYAAKSYIVAKCIQGDFNDPFFFTNSTSMLLDVVPSNDSYGATFLKCNKYFYENINYLYNLTYEEFGKIASIIQVSGSQYDQRLELWPKHLSDEQYKKMFELLKLAFVSENPFPVANTNVFIISINQNFFLKSNERTFRYSGLDTSERKFLSQEFIHTDLTTAINYAIIISNRLWATQGPDNGQYFKKRIIEELQSPKNANDNSKLLGETLKLAERINISPLKFMDYCNHADSFGLSVDKVLAKVYRSYQDTIENNKSMLELYKVYFSNIENPPFYITQIS